MDKSVNSIGDRIKTKREENGYSQDTLARYCSVSKSTIKNWENGTHSPGSEEILRLARVLHTSPDYLLTYSDIDVFTVENVSFEERQILSQIHYLFMRLKDSSNKK